MKSQKSQRERAGYILDSANGLGTRKVASNDTLETHLHNYEINCTGLSGEVGTLSFIPLQRCTSVASIYGESQNPPSPSFTSDCGLFYSIMKIKLLILQRFYFSPLLVPLLFFSLLPLFWLRLRFLFTRNLFICCFYSRSDLFLSLLRFRLFFINLFVFRFPASFLFVYTALEAQAISIL